MTSQIWGCRTGKAGDPVSRPIADGGAGTAGGGRRDDLAMKRQKERHAAKSWTAAKRGRQGRERGKRKDGHSRTRAHADGPCSPRQTRGQGMVLGEGSRKGKNENVVLASLEQCS